MQNAADSNHQIASFPPRPRAREERIPMTSFKTFLMNHWAGVLALLLFLWKNEASTIANYVHNHPHLSFYYGLAGLVITFYAPKLKTQASAN